jgi:hypothetical protein
MMGGAAMGGYDESDEQLDRPQEPEPDPDSNNPPRRGRLRR